MSKNRVMKKLRAYRDKLVLAKTATEATNRALQVRLHEVRAALQKGDSFRAYAVATNSTELDAGYVCVNELVAELTLVYRFLKVERAFTKDIHMSVRNKDWLRTLALCANHELEEIAHEKMLTKWSTDHGFAQVTLTAREQVTLDARIKIRSTTV